MTTVRQIPVLFLPKRGANDQKASINDNTSEKNNNNGKGSIHVKEKNDDKSTAYLLRAS